MSALPNTPPPGVTKDSVAKRLADAHRAADASLSAIYRIESPREGDPNEPIKLLEVTPNTTASGIMPVYLTPHAPSGIFYPSVVVEIHPSEFELLQSGSLQLPHGWWFNPAHRL